MSFDPWAELYDTLHPGLDGEASFYVLRALDSGGPVLELGCGTGRVALAMALSGVEVVGLDLSEPMLEVAADKREALGQISGSVELVCGDMRDFVLGRRFPLIAMPYRSFMHLHSPDDQRACLSAVRDHLTPGGVFIFNTWAARLDRFGAFNGQLSLVDRYPLDDGGALLHFMATQVLADQQRLMEEHLVHELDADGVVLFSQGLSLTRTWTTYRELLHLVSGAGFEVVEVLGGFDGNAFDGQADEMVWVLRAGST